MTRSPPRGLRPRPRAPRVRALGRNEAAASSCRRRRPVVTRALIFALRQRRPILLRLVEALTSPPPLSTPVLQRWRTGRLGRRVLEKQHWPSHRYSRRHPPHNPVRGAWWAPFFSHVVQFVSAWKPIRSARLCPAPVEASTFSFAPILPLLANVWAAAGYDESLSSLRPCWRALPQVRVHAACRAQ